MTICMLVSVEANNDDDDAATKQDDLESIFDVITTRTDNDTCQPDQKCGQQNTCRRRRQQRAAWVCVKSVLVVMTSSLSVVGFARKFISFCHLLNYLWIIFAQCFIAKIIFWKLFIAFFTCFRFFFNSRHHQGCWKQRSYPLFKRVNLNYIGVEFNENKREKTWSNRSWEKSWKSVIMLRTGQGRRSVFKVLHGKFNKSLHPSFRWL